jgi:Flp pilus assembly protein TadG
MSSVRPSRRPAPRVLVALAQRAARLRPSEERGYAALLVAILFPVVFVALAAIAVDTARWFVEVQRVQNAADAGSLAGVTYMPQDFTNATAMAKAVSARNGYTDGVDGATVLAEQGGRPSQLKVTVTSTVNNVFGKLIGVPTTSISRSSTSDYTGPAPMGSPCNTFGNEPSSGGGASSVTPTGTVLPTSGRFANCSSNPAFWATIEGPETDKNNGDRYSTKSCANSAYYSCASGKNTEYNEQGYFWVVKVQPSAINRPVTVQLYDPAFTYTDRDCHLLPAASALSDNMNPYVKLDGKKRYVGDDSVTSSTGSSFCTGDFYTATFGGTVHPMVTSFEMRQQTDTQDPMQGAPITGCIKQYKTGTGSGTAGVPVVGDLLSSSTTYDDQLAQVFHNWTTLCTFTPTREGDYYLHVRSNVKAAGTTTSNTNGNGPIIYSGNSAVSATTGDTSPYGEGDNSFGIRLVTDPGYENLVSVAGFDRMPIFANADAATSTINLIRVLPGAAGQYVSFSFFDVGDASSSGTVKVLPPTDATGTITSTPYPGGCRAQLNDTGTVSSLTNCTANINNSQNNGMKEEMSIPIPSDYTCNFASNGGCWYRVQVSFPSGTVNDITTWDASIVGDPVRLIK